VVRLLYKDFRPSELNFVVQFLATHAIARVLSMVVLSNAYASGYVAGIPTPLWKEEAYN
jgi:hypothetical protein